MQSRLRGNEYRTTVVCVDSYRSQIFSGRFYNPYLEDGESFDSLTQLLLKLDRTLDRMNLPQAFNSVRSFSPSPTDTPADLACTDRQEGRLATFALRIIFRQNASWQGSVTWLEKGREESFRSVLELIYLMDSALAATESTWKES